MSFPSTSDQVTAMASLLSSLSGILDGPFLQPAQEMDLGSYLAEASDPERELEIPDTENLRHALVRSLRSLADSIETGQKNEIEIDEIVTAIKTLELLNLA